MKGLRLCAALAVCLAAAARAQADSGVEWVKIPGGKFMMGSDKGSKDEKPRRSVTISAFELAKSEVTSAQYRKCVEAGACTKAACGSPGDEHPVACVNWFQAKAFSAWAGGRLPTEAEWEYAARSGGREWSYPWGDEEASCARAVMISTAETGCGRTTTWPVCSKPAGLTRHGVCDMAGSVWEWVEDPYHESYAGAPADGKVWEVDPEGKGAQALRVSRDPNDPPEQRMRKDDPVKPPRPGAPLRDYLRIVRGGAWNYDAKASRATFRSDDNPNSSHTNIGFRPARTR